MLYFHSLSVGFVGDDFYFLGLMRYLVGHIGLILE